MTWRISVDDWHVHRLYRVSGGRFIFSNLNKKRNNWHKVLLRALNDTIEMRILFFKEYVIQMSSVELNTLFKTEPCVLRHTLQ